MIRLLETWESEVVYEFDRSHENLPDEYYAKAESEGVQFLFDEDQRLTTIFLYVSESEGFRPVDLAATDVPVFGDPAQVTAFAADRSIAVSEGKADFLGELRKWVRLEWTAYTIHYEFRGGILALVTLTVV